MRLFRTLLVCAVMLAVPVSMSLAAAGPNGKRAAPVKGDKKEHVHATRGVVAAVKRDGDRENGSITVRVHEKGKGKAGGKDRYETKTFQVFAGVTKSEKVQNGKRVAAYFKDVDKGDRVLIYPVDDRPNIARLVEIIGHKKEKNHAVRGVVTTFRRDGDKDNGSFTVRVKDPEKTTGGKKDGYDLKTFQVIPETKFVKIHGGQRQEAHFKDLKVRQLVEVYPIDDRPDYARLVEILDRDR
jgi:hypothetical protein